MACSACGSKKRNRRTPATMKVGATRAVPTRSTTLGSFNSTPRQIKSSKPISINKAINKK